MYEKGSTTLLKEQTEATFTGLKTGAYTVKVSVIVNKIPVETTEKDRIINQPEEIKINPSLINNVVCFGEKRKVKINPTGGTGILSYQWRKKGSTSVISTNEDLTAVAGSYNVTITDANTCSKTFNNIIINQPTKALSIDTLTEDATINKKDVPSGINLDGRITATVTGGWGSYKHVWKNQSGTTVGGNSNILDNVGAGLYSLTVIDRDGCSVTILIEVKEPKPIGIAISYPDETDQISCKGANNATIKVGFATDGPIIESFKWYKTTKTNFISGTENKEILDNRNPGFYGVEVIINNNDGVPIKIYPTKDFEVTEPDVLEIDTVKTKPNDINCFGEKGSFDLFVKGGTESYAYQLSKDGGKSYELQVSFNGNVNIPELVYGDYQVKIRDANNCSLKEDYKFKIEQPEQLVITKLDNKDATVFSELESDGSYKPVPNGIILVKVEGGLPFNPTTTPHYEYVLTDKGGVLAPRKGITTTNFSGEEVIELRDVKGSFLGVDYILTVTDSSPNGCPKTTDYTIKEPEKLIVSLKLDKNVNCFSGNDGQLSLSVVGGKTTDYRYEWFKKKAGVFKSLGATKPVEIEVGEYKVKVTVIFEGKETESKETNVIEVREPTPLKVIATIQKVRCLGGSDGEIKLEVSGGTIGGSINTTYEYDWSNTKKNKDISGLIAGIYTVKITYNGSCQFIETYSIEEPEKELVGNLDIFENPTRNELDLDGTIPDGSITANISDGRPPYIYEWTDALGNVVGNNSKTLANVGGGNYTLKVTDDNGLGCVKIFTRELEEPEPFLVSIDPLLVKELKCFGDDNGSIKVTVEGGLTPYTYKWYKILADKTKEYFSITKGTLQTLKDIGVGTYGVEVTDNAGIKTTKSTEFELIQNDKLEITYKVDPVTCYKGKDGAIDINVTGGTGIDTYTYSWRGGEKTKKITGLAAGKYSVRVSDENKCVVEEIDIEVTQPEEHKVTAMLTIPRGAGEKDGKIIVNITGNTTPYTLEWEDVDGKRKETIKTIEGLKAGDYILRLKVEGGCTFEYKFMLKEPEKLKIKVEEVGGINCYGDLSGTLKLETEGGVGDAKYKWYKILNKDINTKEEIKRASGFKEVSGFSSGDYIAEVTDFNGIKAESDIYTITQPSFIEVTSSSENVSCFEKKDGIINLEAKGGTGKYYYSVSKDGGDYGTEVEFTDTTVISNLDIGDYDVKVRDENRCDLKENGVNKILNFTITQPKALEITEKITHVTGFGLDNGSIIAAVTGGTHFTTTDYKYSWKDVTGKEIAITKDIFNQVAGTYTLEVTDANTCFIRKEITINQPDLLKVTVQQQNIVLCKGDKTASIASTIIGGQKPYKAYAWYKKGETSVQSPRTTLSSIGIGTYYLIVTDTNDNVTQSADIVIEEPDFLRIQLTSKSEGCGTTDDWTIEANVSGGTAPFKYFWSTGETTKDITQQSLGTYFVVITDANGCQITERITLENTNIFNVIPNVKEIVCYNNCSGEITLDIQGGFAPYTILWNTGATTQSIKNLCAGEYTVEVEDSNGCREIKTVTLQNPEEFIFELIPDKVTLCQDEDIEYDVTMNNVVSYNWTSDTGFRSNKSMVTLSEGGNYTLTVVTNEGCSISRNLEITKSDIVIDAQLILTSQAFAGEEIAIINVSAPISSNVDWEIPSNVTIIQKEKEGVVVEFPAPGDYEISLVSSEGDCNKKQTKIVTVLKARNLVDVGDTEGPFIKEYKVYANPNKGQFKVDVVLEKEAEISLRLFGLGANTTTLDREFKGEKEYTIDYDMNVPVGIYILLLETSKAKRIIKVIIE